MTLFLLTMILQLAAVDTDPSVVLLIVNLTLNSGMATFVTLTFVRISDLRKRMEAVQTYLIAKAVDPEAPHVPPGLF